jgi:hypothetical protein
MGVFSSGLWELLQSAAGHSERILFEHRISSEICDSAVERNWSGQAGKPNRRPVSRHLSSDAHRTLESAPAGADSECTRGDRTEDRRQSPASFRQPLPATAGSSGRAANHPPFRPTVSRPCGSQTKTTNTKQNPLQSTSRSPLEGILEANISKLPRIGHFYFALTVGPPTHSVTDNCLAPLQAIS